MPALYIHIPFCTGKCPYCDFFSRSPRTNEITAYIEALCLDIDYHLAGFLNGAALKSVFFGGGTPSLLSAAQIDTILSHIYRCAALADDIEISLEGNPCSCNDSTRLRDYRRAGVNRLSLGVQSFNDADLLFLGRRHNAATAMTATELALNNFDNVNIDLMFALPTQNNASVEHSCQLLHQLQPQHLSVYGLSIEANTPFATMLQQKEIAAVDEELFHHQFLHYHKVLTALGYEHYEISNYARPGYRCHHNLTYWQRRPYLGIGAGAHSFIADGWGQRLAAPDSIEQYIEAVTTGKTARALLETFDHTQAMAEFAYLGLRCCDGIDERQFQHLFGCSFSAHFSHAISRCGHHLHRDNSRWHMDSASWLLYDHLISAFL